MNSLQGKVAVVTGGNSGIGYTTAQSLKAKGAEVVIAGRSAEKVATAAQELGVTGIVADVTDMAALDALVEQVKTKHSNVDILFVNAGVFLPTPVGAVTVEAYTTQMNINVQGAIFTVEKFVPILNDGASIITLSSVAADTPMHGGAIYSATKAALNAYTRSAAVELAGRKIRVNSVSPGPVETPIFNKAGFTEEQVGGMAAMLQEKVVLGRLGNTTEVANLVTFLASDEASFITGGDYKVDGGIALQAI